MDFCEVGYIVQIGHLPNDDDDETLFSQGGSNLPVFRPLLGSFVVLFVLQTRLLGFDLLSCLLTSLQGPGFCDRILVSHANGVQTSRVSVAVNVTLVIVSVYFADSKRSFQQRCITTVYNER